MKCIKKQQMGDGYLTLCETPTPKISDTDVLIKVKATAICGTDIHILHWDTYAQKRMKPPTIIGHEYAGEVVAIGANVTKTKVGDIVTSDSHLVCFSCALCKEGHTNVCENTEVIGVTRDGSFAEYISIPEKDIMVCDHTIPIEQIALMEPLGVAVHAAMTFDVKQKNVVVSGCGPIGCMCVAVLKKLNTKRIIAIEPNTERANIAKQMGADEIYNPLEEYGKTKLSDIDVVLDFSGNHKSLQSAIDYIKPEGCICLVGIGNNQLQIDYENFVTKGICLKGISGREIPKTWQQIHTLFENGLDIQPIITHTFSLEEFETAFTQMETGNCGKIILKP